MDMERFVCSVEEGLMDRLGEEYETERKMARGINGTEKYLLEIKKTRENIHPCFRMDEYYGKYISGEMGIAGIIEEICECCGKDTFYREVDMSYFTCWDLVNGNIRCRLVNTEKNRDFLQKVPHREYLDLSLIYYAVVPEMGKAGEAAIQITDEHMALWGVEEESLHTVAWKNMPEKDMLFDSIYDVVSSFIESEMAFSMEKQPVLPMYVLSNKEKSNGAVWICRPEILQKIGDILDDDYIILPSSIHDVIIIPRKYQESDWENLAQMVEEVNDSQLAEDEILSYHVYLYNREKEKMEIAV